MVGWLDSEARTPSAKWCNSFLYFLGRVRPLGSDSGIVNSFVEFIAVEVPLLGFDVTGIISHE